MRLKGQKQQQANRNQINNDESRNELLNGSSASCSSASAIGAQDDLDNGIDSSADVIFTYSIPFYC